ncbi:hypothetical protein K491DRAFT_259403 [Lophiostoma macrostomum CBS 122681]|uniref:Uncharacterized protein n=1 Tax=Lophiostoma macrostomum CBS 122681 TaxID=1314788 RepID=A0A6A6TEX9_9PLEO|nr:hypothetical protein K491DRAFT_259403 [Lophiostoma macrostomum CBS 122681]
MRAENPGPWRNKCSHCWAIWYNSTNNGKHMYPEGDDNLRIAQLDELEQSTKKLEDEVGRWAEDLRTNTAGSYDQTTIQRMREHIRVMGIHMRHERGLDEANSARSEVSDPSSTSSSSTSESSTKSSGSVHRPASDTWIYGKRSPDSRGSSLETVIHVPLVSDASNQSDRSTPGNSREFPLAGGSRLTSSESGQASTSDPASTPATLRASRCNAPSDPPSYNNIEPRSIPKAITRDSAPSKMKVETASQPPFANTVWPGYTAPLVLLLILLFILFFLEFLLVPLIEHIQCELLNGSFGLFDRAFDWCIIL